jgi:hypothetical protein
VVFVEELVLLWTERARWYLLRLFRKNSLRKLKYEPLFSCLFSLLLSHFQVVLQGKSRDVIVRELQRTNLNVNEAVNNLLSRDDDEGIFVYLLVGY